MANANEVPRGVFFFFNDIYPRAILFRYSELSYCLRSIRMFGHRYVCLEKSENSENNPFRIDVPKDDGARLINDTCCILDHVLAYMCVCTKHSPPNRSIYYVIATREGKL